MKFTIQFFKKRGSTKPTTFELLSVDQARKVARIAADFTDASVRSFTITVENGGTERWFHLEGSWQQMH